MMNTPQRPPTQADLEVTSDTPQQALPEIPEQPNESDASQQEPGGVADPSIAEPLFLQADKPETWDKPAGVTWGDHFLKPGKALKPRHKELARLAFMGKSNKEIAETLDYTDSRVSILLTNSEIQKEIEAFREKAFEKTVAERLTGMSQIAADTIEEILLDEKEKASLRMETAKWVLEKLTGKPGQQIEVKTTTLNVFLNMLEQAKQAGQIIDVTPGAPPVVENLPEDLGEREETSYASKFADWVETET